MQTKISGTPSRNGTTDIVGMPKTFVYNPFSILSYFDEAEFGNFWFETGTPKFLIDILKEKDYYEAQGEVVGQSAFSSYDIHQLEVVPLLIQTGYLTVKHIRKKPLILYTLDYPNKEVKDSMYEHLIGAFSHDAPTKSSPLVYQLSEAFNNEDIEKVIYIINGLFSNIPNQIFIAKKKPYYHSLVYLVFNYLGQILEAEVNTNIGRIDTVLQTDTTIFIIEFKLDQSADAALEQVHKKNYAGKYANSPKKILGIGINFSSELKRVEDWKVEVLKE